MNDLKWYIYVVNDSAEHSVNWDVANDSAEHSVNWDVANDSAEHSVNWGSFHAEILSSN